jgi:hypothetical protein
MQMSIWVDIVQSGSGVAAVVIGYIALSHKRRAEAKIIAVRWGSYLGAAVIGGASVFEIYKFGTSTEPMTRRDVLWLLLNLWNAIAYIGCGIALAVVWRKLDNKAKADLKISPNNAHKKTGPFGPVL